MDSPIRLGDRSTRYAEEVNTAFEILAALSFCHLLNDMMQSLIPAIYPILKENLRLDFTQIGLITLVLQMTGALLQPVIGFYADRRPWPYALAAGMGFSLAGMILLSKAGSFALVLAATSLVGLGSSVFHPESSRICLLYTSPSPRDRQKSRMPSSA